MARYIDADKLFRYVDEQTHLSKGKLQNYIRENHTADVVEVVRCRNCANFKEIIKDKAGICYHRNSNGLRGITDFCSYGVKRDGGS